MNDEQIITRARQEVAARQAVQIDQRWGGHRRGLSWVLVLVTVLGFLAAPGSLPHKLLLAMGGLCALHPDHSYFAGGLQLPLEARMTGIYGGFLLTLTVLLIKRRLGARHLGSWAVIGTLAVFFATMAFDGINSTLAEVNLPHLYTPTNTLRLLTGLLSGIAIAPGLLWLLNVVAVPPTALRRAVLRSPRELLGPLVLNGMFAVIVADGRAALYFPVALISVVGILVVLAAAVLLVILVVGRLEGRVTRVRELVAPAALAMLITFAAVALLAVLRWSTLGSV